MVNIRKSEETLRIKSKVLYASAMLFLKKGYQLTTIKDIANQSKINASTVLYVFKSKEDILCELVKYVIEGQFNAASKVILPYTDDKILYYGLETALQLYMAESSESIRELYMTVYTLPKTLQLVRDNITDKLYLIFKEHLPYFTTKDFYETEIASSSLIRGYMEVKCHDDFTIKDKVNRFLDTSLLIYRVSDEKIREAKEFVSQFDIQIIADETIQSMIDYLENQNKGE